MYAIVDIETTGSFAAANGITEIAIHIFDGKKTIEKYETLINPLQPIPYYIQRLTGISDEMVADAPTFDVLAPKIFELLNNKIFIAHNVNFDYSFVKAHLAQHGFLLDLRKLCSIRLARKIFPGFTSYGLNNLSHALGIQIKNQHRAGADATATTKIFKLLLQNDKECFIEKSLQRNSKESILPPNVPKEHFEKLPYTAGVYYFHNEKGKTVYVGKANNIRKRVISHFSNNSKSRQKQNFMRHVFSISFQETATELMAHILEATEIKKLWPVFNSSQKRQEDVYGIFCFEDQNGYARLAIEKNKSRLNPIVSFHYLAEGHTILRKMIATFSLCHQLCFMQKKSGSCEDDNCKGACEKKETTAQYNERVYAAIQSLNQQPSFAIIEKGLHADDLSCVLVCKGQFYGMGYLNSDFSFSDTANIKALLSPQKETLFIRNLVHNYATKFPEKVKWFD